MFSFHSHGASTPGQTDLLQIASAALGSERYESLATRCAGLISQSNELGNQLARNLCPWLAASLTGSEHLPQKALSIFERAMESSSATRKEELSRIFSEARGHLQSDQFDTCLHSLVVFGNREQARHLDAKLFERFRFGKPAEIINVLCELERLIESELILGHNASAGERMERFLPRIFEYVSEQQGAVRSYFFDQVCALLQSWANRNPELVVSALVEAGLACAGSGDEAKAQREICVALLTNNRFFLMVPELGSLLSRKVSKPPEVSNPIVVDALQRLGTHAVNSLLKEAEAEMWTSRQHALVELACGMGDASVQGIVDYARAGSPSALKIVMLGLYFCAQNAEQRRYLLQQKYWSKIDDIIGRAAALGSWRVDYFVAQFRKLYALN